MTDFTQKLTADVADPSDIVLWLGDNFAGNVGHRVQEIGLVFDIDADFATEIARRWNTYAALEAQIAAADRLADAALGAIGTLNSTGSAYEMNAAKALRRHHTAYLATKG